MFDWLGDIISRALAMHWEMSFPPLENRSPTPSGYHAPMVLTTPFTTLWPCSSPAWETWGADIFTLGWVDATIRLFTLLGWSLFAVGVVVAVFDVAIEFQSGRANLKTIALNVLKGFFACSLIGPVPVELYKLCISLQNTSAGDPDPGLLRAAEPGPVRHQHVGLGGRFCGDIRDTNQPV